MGKFNHFVSENIGLSFVGHLIVAAMFIVVADVVLDGRERFVAPDRIEILMIDLDQVKVSGAESMLYNTSVPDEPLVDKAKETEITKTPEQDAAPDVQEKIETPTVVPEEEPKKVDDTKAPEEKNPDDTPAPKKTTVIRVKRESLKRTLNLNTLDALRIKMTRCWIIDSSRPDIDGIRAVAHLKMRKNATVADLWFESAARAETDPGFAYVLETIRSAINTCQPLDMLPPDEYDEWRDIQLTFYPTTGSVM